MSIIAIAATLANIKIAGSLENMLLSFKANNGRVEQLDSDVIRNSDENGSFNWRPPSDIEGVEV